MTGTTPCTRFQMEMNKMKGKLFWAIVLFALISPSFALSTIFETGVVSGFNATYQPLCSQSFNVTGTYDHLNATMTAYTPLSIPAGDAFDMAITWANDTVITHTIWISTELNDLIQPVFSPTAEITGNGSYGQFKLKMLWKNSSLTCLMDGNLYNGGEFEYCPFGNCQAGRDLVYASLSGELVPPHYTPYVPNYQTGDFIAIVVDVVGKVAEAIVPLAPVIALGALIIFL